jgi:hypothetical protein
MKLRHSLSLLTLAAVSAACGFRRTPVPLTSDNGSVQALVGSWAGEYSSTETGRSGSITFSLASEKDTAYGDVTMIARTRVAPLVTSPQQSGAVISQPQAQPLTIRFVRMEGDRVIGRLAPYDDPQCACRVVTTFQGRFSSSNTIEGTYDTRGTGIGHQPSAGKWKVTRQTPPETR